MSRGRTWRAALIATVASALAFLLYYSVLIDLSDYIEDLEAEQLARMFESVDTLASSYDDESLDVSDERLAALDDVRDNVDELHADGFDDAPSFLRNRLSEREADRVADEWARAGLTDPLALLDFAALCRMEAEGVEHFRASVEWSAERSGRFAEAVIYLNSWRIDDLFQEQMELSRSNAEEALSHMTVQQRALLASSCDEHGGALLDAVLKVRPPEYDEEWSDDDWN